MNQARRVVAGVLVLGLASMCFATGTNTDAPKVGQEDIRSLADANNAFALDLYGRLKQENGNLFFSPYSISTALAMTWAGARGQTESQMAQVLHFTGRQEAMHPLMGALIESLRAPKDARYQLHVANRLWGERTYDFRKEFLELTDRHYGAGLEPVDFRGAADAVRQVINAWVEEQTKERIKDLLPPGSVDKTVSLVLTNAIYFKGDWAKQFDKAETQNEPFHITPERSADAALMHQKSAFPYFRGDGFAILEMPYVGDKLSMLVLLPDEMNGLPRVESSLSPANLAEWTAKLVERELLVWLPKLELTRDFKLAEVLKGMGMGDAFSGRADFSGMSAPKADALVYISEVFHKAFVKVDEEGTEAAAATAVVLRSTGEPPPPPAFRADHPFIFLIRDRQTSSILFIGRVVDPSKSGD